MMVLLVGNDLWSHRMRIAMTEKGLPAKVEEFDVDDPPPEIKEFNPYLSVPMLVDRDLTLYDSRVILDYLDERFQHPPLLPPNPVVRAQLRLAMHRIERDWYSLVEALDAGDARAREVLSEGILSSVEIFGARHYFLSDDFTIVDATLVPILSRLSMWGITLPERGAPVVEYMKRVFERPSVAASLRPAVAGPVPTRATKAVVNASTRAAHCASAAL
jgi:RNA polymerase-associated protein